MIDDTNKIKHRAYPPGRIKIVQALRKLLEEKDFNSVTTSEIAKCAKVTEGLIYKYFNNKRDLLYETLAECFEEFINNTNLKVNNIKGATEKIKEIIYCYLNIYNTDKVMARMLLLEVRNSKDFYESNAYKMVQMHSRAVLNIIEEGIINKEFKKNIKPSIMRTSLFGAIEHACLPGIIFERDILVDEKAKDIYQIFLNGIKI